MLYLKSMLHTFLLEISNLLNILFCHELITSWKKVVELLTFIGDHKGSPVSHELPWQDILHLRSIPLSCQQYHSCQHIFNWKDDPRSRWVYSPSAPHRLRDRWFTCGAVVIKHVHVLLQMPWATRERVSRTQATDVPGIADRQNRRQYSISVKTMPTKTPSSEIFLFTLNLFYSSDIPLLAQGKRM